MSPPVFTFDMAVEVESTVEIEFKFLGLDECCPEEAVPTSSNKTYQGKAIGFGCFSSPESQPHLCGKCGRRYPAK